VKLINLEKRHDEIASVCKVMSEEDEITIEEKAENEAIENRTVNANLKETDDDDTEDTAEE
jgi:DNA gyrase subunit A